MGKGFEDAAQQDFNKLDQIVKNPNYTKDLSKANVTFIENALSDYKAVHGALEYITNTMLKSAKPEEQKAILDVQKHLEKGVQKIVLDTISKGTKEDSDKTQNKPQTPSQEDIIKQLVADNQDIKANNQFLMDMVMQLHERLEVVENNKQKILCVTEVVYDNELLNHPELLKASVEEFGISRVLDMSSNLSSELISEAIEQNDAELLLAGCISLNYSDVI